jgi:hypothetical protein
MSLFLVELAPGCSDGAIVKWHLPEQKQCEDGCGITLETAEAETKGGTSQYNMKNRSGHEQEQTPDQKTNRQSARSPKHLSKNSCTAKKKLQPK